MTMFRNMFGKDDTARRIHERVTYAVTDDGARQIEEYKLSGVREQILGQIYLKRGSCTMADLEAKTNQSAGAIQEQIEDMEGLGWLTQRRASRPMGSSPFPQGYGRSPYSNR